MCETELMIKTFRELSREEDVLMVRLKVIHAEMEKTAKLISEDPDWVEVFLNTK